jgi:hypothetical protein
MSRPMAKIDDENDDDEKDKDEDDEEEEGWWLDPEKVILARSFRLLSHSQMLPLSV